jgi:hypothetical protein
MGRIAYKKRRLPIEADRAQVTPERSSVQPVWLATPGGYAVKLPNSSLGYTLTLLN